MKKEDSSIEEIEAMQRKLIYSLYGLKEHTLEELIALEKANVEDNNELYGEDWKWKTNIK